MRARYLVCYDIADSRRLGRVFRLLKGSGVHLQYSVFLLSLTRDELRDLERRLLDLIEAREDDVRLYPLPAGPVIQPLGLDDRVPEGVVVALP